MTLIEFSLPENLREFFEARLAELGIEAPEYLERLVREEKKRLIGEYYLKEVQKGIESGEPIPGHIVHERVAEQLRVHRKKKCKVTA